MRFQLPPLPYPLGALEPHISRETLEYHYGKHHKGYVDKLNSLVRGTPFESASLTEIVRDAPPGKVFNNAAQVWNHSFFWEGMTPSQNAPSERLSGILAEHFDSVEGFKDRFSAEAADIFGTGWEWLVQRDDGSLALVPEEDAGNPLREGYHPLLTCDVWEHAYYIDYRNERAKFLQAFWKVVNWNVLESRLRPIQSQAARGERGASAVGEAPP